MGGFVRKYIQKRQKPRVQQQAVKQAPSGPTKAEIDAIRFANIKRKGRSGTKLGVNDEDLYLSTKALLS